MFFILFFFFFFFQINNLANPFTPFPPKFSQSSQICCTRITQKVFFLFFFENLIIFLFGKGEWEKTSDYYYPLKLNYGPLWLFKIEWSCHWEFNTIETKKKLGKFGFFFSFLFGIFGKCLMNRNFAEVIL